MLSKIEKIVCLELTLNKIEDNYADSLKTDILFFIGDFDENNSCLDFLDKLTTKQEVDSWVDKLTSRIVMKEHLAGIDEIISDYIELG
jgi:hypothetical protein